MSPDFSPGLSMQMSQRMEMVMTPQMIQSMEMLQLPLMALEQKIHQKGLSRCARIVPRQSYRQMPDWVRFADAVAWEEKALGIWSKHFGEEHPHVKIGREMLARYKARAGGAP